MQLNIFVIRKFNVARSQQYHHLMHIGILIIIRVSIIKVQLNYIC